MYILRNLISLVLVILMGTSVLEANADETPFTIKTGLFNLDNEATAGLTRPDGLEKVTVFSPTDNTDHFSNGVVMAAFKGVLYCMWQSSAKDEDSSDTWVAYSRSTDNGESWSEPKVLAPTISNGYRSSGGWLASDDVLVGYINVWPSSLSPKGGYTQYVETTDGETWSEPKDVTMADGSTLNGIFEQDPHVMPGGRIINAAHMQPGLHITPIYTDDPTGRTGWKKGTFTWTENSDKSQSLEMEPSLFRKSDGTIVMIFRDQASSYYKMASTSADNGETWTKIVKTSFPDGRQKQCAGNLPNGTAFIVSTPRRVSKPRTPLCLSLSEDGYLFEKAWLLRGEDNNDHQTLRYSGKAKSQGYSYPKAMVYNGYLYASYATNKEDVEYSRVPLSSLSISNGINQHTVNGLSITQIGSRDFVITGTDGKAVNVIVSTINGQQMVQRKLTSGSSVDNATISLAALPAGLYIITIRCGAETVTHKVVIR